MAHRCVTNGVQSGQTRLPPIRRKYGSINNSMRQDFGYDNLPSSLPRLPRIESRPVVATKTSLPHQERKGTKKSFNSCFAIDEQFPPLRLPATELRNPFERSSEFEGLNGDENPVIGSGVRGVDGIYLDGDLPKNGTFKVKPIVESARPFRRPAQLLRRRLRPSKAYQHNDGQMSHRELLTFDQNMDQLRAFTERDKGVEVKDFNGDKIDPNNNNGNITSYIAMFEVGRRADSSSHDESKSGASTGDTTRPVDDQPAESDETKTRVRGRFYEALDLHFYHYYRNTLSERRMAICEEIEQSITVDNITLSWYRENLRLQDVLNMWML